MCAFFRLNRGVVFRLEGSVRLAELVECAFLGGEHELLGAGAGFGSVE